MGQIEDLRAFVRIVEFESIGKAAEAAGIAKSAMSRKLRLLEERLQTELITRTTRQWALSDTGREFYDRAVDILAALDEAEAQVRCDSRSLSGDIRLSVPLHFGRMVLAPALLDFAAAHAGLRLTVDFDDRIVDVIGENYHLVVRVSQPPDSSLIARKLTETRHVLCASPHYLARNPPIETPADLHHHRIIQFGPARHASWTLQSPTGAKTTVRLRAVLNSGDGAFLIDAAASGLGVARVPDYLADPEIRTGRLVRVLHSYGHEPRGVHVLYPATRHLPVRVRVLLDFLVRRTRDL